ncbi:MAG TPA: FAD-dependent oxidoreductase [Solirubrobacteraceae bacterium]|nr:FAD-dependent oxidoreductase [Solirubrobacteraceae bacterium]
MTRRNNSLRGVDVAVIGGGAVGVCAAWELARGGASVALLERGPELAWGCSAGNAGIVGPSHVLPLAGPAAVRDGLRWMTRPDSPFYVRPSPAVVPWLGRFAAASAPARVRRSREVLRALAIRSAGLHAGLASAGLDTGYRQAGLLNVFSRESALAAARRDALADERDGIAHEVLTAEDVHVRAPTFAAAPAGALFSPGEARCDPHRFVAAVGSEARAAGVEIRTGIEVLELRESGGRVDSLWTTGGDVPIGELVIAAGVWTSRFGSQLGVELPIEAGKGYHVDVPSGDDPELPIWLHEDRVVITPLDGRVRFAGRGLRPCTPDGLPVIGRPPAIENATLAAGHGMWGLQLAPVTSELVARVIVGDDSGSDLSPLRADRFQIRDRSPIGSAPQLS